MKSIRGFLYGFSEMGSEGIHWTLADPKLPGYGGLHTIEAGNQLRVLDEENDLLWSGIITPLRGRSGDCWVEGKGTVCWLQAGENPASWVSLFDRKLRAELSIESKSSDVTHPLLIPYPNIEAAIKELPSSWAMELFNSALYAMLSWYSGEGWRSVGQDIGLELSDVLLTLGNPSEETIGQWKRFPRRANETGLPYSPELLVRLCGLQRVIAGACMLHGHESERMRWAHQRACGRSPFERMAAGNQSLWDLVAEVEEAVDTLWSNVPLPERVMPLPPDKLLVKDALHSLAKLMDILLSVQAQDEAARGYPARALQELADASSYSSPMHHD